MIVLISGLMLLSTIFSLVYLPAKIIDDIRNNRAGWAAAGSVAMLGIVAQLVLGLVLVFGIMPRL